MPPRKTPTPSLEVPDDVVGSDQAPAEVTDNESGVKEPPYAATWITIKAAATKAGVTGQTVRNAYENHEAFNTPGTAGTEESVMEHWFQTKMIDQFGNVTDYDVVYVDAAAVDRWIAARASKPSTLHDPNAPKRYIIRLNPDQYTQLVAFLGTQDGFEGVAIEKPPQSARKPKGDQPDASTTNGHADEPTPESAATQNDLFDVNLIEA